MTCGRPRRTCGGVYVILRGRLNPDAGSSDKSLPGPTWRQSTPGSGWSRFASLRLRCYLDLKSYGTTASTRGNSVLQKTL